MTWTFVVFVLCHLELTRDTRPKHYHCSFCFKARKFRLEKKKNLRLHCEWQNVFIQNCCLELARWL